MSAKPLNALILGVPNPVSMGIARGWMMAGHKVAAVWYPERAARSRAFQQDLELSKRAPGVTMHGLADRAKVTVQPVKRMREWEGAVSAAKALEPDFVLSLLFPDRIPLPFLQAFQGRVLNLHPSLLPAYRGPAPIFNMLWDRTISEYSGLTLHLVSPEFDRGDVLGRVAVPFPASRNLSAYYMELVKAGTSLIAGQVPAFLSGSHAPEPQVDTHSAPQGNRKLRDAVLRGTMSAEHITWLSSTIPQMTPLRIEGLAANVIVAGPASIQGVQQKTPPIVMGGVAEFDAADARVRVPVKAGT